MMQQMTLEDARDDFDPATGLTLSEWTTCAQWCRDHPQATRWIVSETKSLNEIEGRAVSMRIDIEPTLKKRAREWGLDGGAYSGIDHRLTASLVRYLMQTRPGLKFRLRSRVGDNVKNATPECAR